MINKIARSVAEALDGTPDGARVLIGGFGTAGISGELIEGLIAQGSRDLTVVDNNAGNGDPGPAALLKAGLVRRILCSSQPQADCHGFDAPYLAGYAGKQLVTPLRHQADSFAMMLGGHSDICVLGAFQINSTGDLANWSTCEAGAKQTWVMTDLLTQAGESKVVARCTYPLTGIGCVKRIYTDIATFDSTPQGLKLINTVDGLEHAQLERPVRQPII